MGGMLNVKGAVPIIAIVGLMVGGVLSLIGIDLIGQPLAASVVAAGGVANAGYLATFLKLVPLLSAVGIMTAMFGASNLGTMGGDLGITVILKMIAIIVSVIMLPILFLQLGAATTTYAKDICLAATDATATTCAATSIAGAATSFTAGATGTVAGKFTAIGQILPLIPLAYIMAIIYFVLPSGVRERQITSRFRRARSRMGGYGRGYRRM